MDFSAFASFVEVNQEKEPERWLELRKTGLGGSDAGAVMGMNKYASPLSIYFQKKGIESGFKGNAATKWGHILESPIRAECEKEMNVKIHCINGMFTSLQYPYMNANVDGIIEVPEGYVSIVNGHEISGIGGHEIKTSSRGEGFSDDEIPDAYYCQVQHYMVVLGLPWFVLTVFILDSKELRHYYIERNQKWIDEELIPCEKDFWENNVMAEIIPAPSGCDNEDLYIKSLPIDATITLDEETECLIAEERELAKKLESLKSEHSKIKNQILLALHRLSSDFEESDKVLATSTKYKITYNTQVRKLIDTVSLKKDGLYERYATDSFSKVLRISEIKGR